MSFMYVYCVAVNICLPGVTANKRETLCKRKCNSNDSKGLEGSGQKTWT